MRAIRALPKFMKRAWFDLMLHTVQSGDTLYRLAREFGVSVQDIVDANGLSAPDTLTVGQSLIIPLENRIHTVKSGQSLFTIARSYGISLDRLLEANPNLRAPYTIFPGQHIYIPLQTEKLGSIEVNGFATPAITDENLTRTLKHLTYISIFSYSIMPNGELAELQNDERILRAARSAGVAPLLVLTNLQQGAGFDSELAADFLDHADAWNPLLEQLLEIMQRKGYWGLNLDFEYIPPRCREQYNRFLQVAKARLSAQGYKLFTCLAPKLSDTQAGTLYEAHDYAAHGEIADRVILMTYEWGYLYGPPMAVSPYDQVRRVLDYAVSRIPREKLLMSLPGYGYDWTLPYMRGSRAVTLSITQAADLANRVDAQIQFDTDSATPFFEYYDANGRRHIVWFEDARSAREKLLLIHEYGLAGVSYWTINSFWPQNWATLDMLYNVKRVL